MQSRNSMFFGTTLPSAVTRAVFLCCSFAMGKPASVFRRKTTVRSILFLFACATGTLNKFSNSLQISPALGSDTTTITLAFPLWFSLTIILSALDHDQFAKTQSSYFV